MLIGTSTYDDPNLADVPGVANNLTDLHGLLTAADGTGMPNAHCTLLADPPTPAAVAERLTQAATEAEDLLLVFYAGHGLPWSSTHELYLAMANTKTSIVGSSALRCAEVREIFLRSTARTRVLIVDCCFSGRAVEQLMNRRGLGGSGGVPGVVRAGGCDADVPGVVEDPDGAQIVAAR